MYDFNIVKTSPIKKTFRVAKIANDFDLNIDETKECFKGNLDLPEKWNVGLIVGNSGTGKTTIAKELFKDNIISGFNYTHESVIDDMPQNLSVTEISKIFYAVGFGSVPSWLKPYSVLSNGEKMRVDIARAISEKDFVVFDEFTSVVDRNVGKVVSMAVSKAIRKMNKKFVAISCHEDIIDWLAPDWIFNTDEMKFHFIKGGVPKNVSQLEKVTTTNGENIASITI